MSYLMNFNLYKYTRPNEAIKSVYFLMNTTVTSTAVATGLNFY